MLLETYLQHKLEEMADEHDLGYVWFQQARVQSNFTCCFVKNVHWAVGLSEG
jgi:hypothetical protein